MKKTLTATPFRIPKSFLNQLNEFSKGGFLLITISEDGHPVLNQHFDDTSAAFTIQSYASLWAAAMHNYNQAGVMNQVLNILKKNSEK